MGIKEYCKEFNTTLTKLARQLNISISYISRIASKQIRPNVEIKRKLEELGIDVSMEDTSSYKTKKNERIKKLLLENNRLKQENKNLKESIIPKIEKLLEKQLKKYKGE